MISEVSSLDSMKPHFDFSPTGRVLEACEPIIERIIAIGIEIIL